MLGLTVTFEPLGVVLDRMFEEVRYSIGHDRWELQRMALQVPAAPTSYTTLLYPSFIYIYVYMYIYIYIYIYIYVCMYVCIYVYVCMYVCIHMYIYTYIYYIHMYGGACSRLALAPLLRLWMKVGQVFVAAL